MAHYSRLPTYPQSGSQSTLHSVQKHPLRPMLLHAGGKNPPAIGLEWWLFANGLVDLLWGIALMVFSIAQVPISWDLSQYGKGHPELTNIIVNIIASVSSLHLDYTIGKTAIHHTRMALDGDGIHLRKWHRMQKFADASISPPRSGVLTWFPYLGWVPWFLMFGGLAIGNGASITAILQPVPYYQHVQFPDTTPCGIPPAELSFSLNLPIQPTLDDVAFQIGLQLGNYYNQAGANVVTAVAGRSYTKDNFGYAAIGGLINGLQDMPGVEINAHCGHDTRVNDTLWDTILPDVPFPTVNIIDGAGSFSESVTSSATLAVIAPGPFNLTGSHVAMFSAVNTLGSGGIVTVDRKGTKNICTWDAIPRLVNVTTENFVASTLGAVNATLVPSPTAGAVLSVIQGMTEATRLGARLDWDFPLGKPAAPPGNYANSGNTSIPYMLQTLIADGVKAALTAYTLRWVELDEDPDQDPVTVLGASVTGGSCSANNRTLSQHWRFGNGILGIIAIGQSVGIGCLAIIVAHKRGHARFDPFDVTEVLKLRVASPNMSGALHDEEQLLQVRAGQIIFPPQGSREAPGLRVKTLVAVAAGIIAMVVTLIVTAKIRCSGNVEECIMAHMKGDILS
ncbi:hypothetical protein C8R43DRAFT_1232395 [Mycena crocata]|nr:hypothetical protein C8R43DRAFT_1232395 [Mycena crocata]